MIAELSTPETVSTLRQEVEEAIAPILERLANGNREREEEALWAIRKAVEGLGIRKRFEPFFRLNMDGFEVTYGSNVGYEKEDAQLEGYGIGYFYAMPKGDLNG